MNSSTKTPEHNPRHETSSSRGRESWLKSVRGEALRVGRIRGVNWDAFTPPTRASTRTPQKAENQT